MCVVKEKNRKSCVFVCFCVWVALPRRIIRRAGRRRIFFCSPETAICSTYYVSRDGRRLITGEIRLPCILEHTGVMMNYCTDIVSIVNVDVVLYNCIMYCVVLELQFLDALASLKPCWTMFNGHSLMFSRFCHLLSQHYQSQNKDKDKSAHLAQIFGPILGLFIREWIITSTDVWQNQT